MKPFTEVQLNREVVNTSKSALPEGVGTRVDKTA